MVKAHITSDYNHNIPLAKKVCGGTDDDDKYLEGMLQQTTTSAKKNMKDTWFDGGYNSNKNIALSHVEFGLTPHYHIDADWRQNVKYEHKFNGKVYNYTPEQEIKSQEKLQRGYQQLYEGLSWTGDPYKRKRHEKYRPSCSRVPHSDTCSSFNEITKWNNKKSIFSCLFDLRRFE